MEWRKYYMDLMLVPLGLVIILAYHFSLWHKSRTQPFATIFGRDADGRRLWVPAMMKKLLFGGSLMLLYLEALAEAFVLVENPGAMLQEIEDIDKKNILVVQVLRNLITGSTLMATASILICAGLGAVISSTYSVKKPINDSVIEARGEFVVALKYTTLLVIFICSFLCHTLSIRFLNQVSILICTPQDIKSLVTPEYLSELLRKATILNIVGNRLFYSALTLLLWICGSLLNYFLLFNGNGTYTLQR